MCGKARESLSSVMESGLLKRSFREASGLAKARHLLLRHPNLCVAAPGARNPNYMGMGSLAWRATYQQGFCAEWGKSEFAQDTSSSGCKASTWYSVLLPLSEIARRRVRCMEPEARP